MAIGPDGAAYALGGRRRLSVRPRPWQSHCAHAGIQPISRGGSIQRVYLVTGRGHRFWTIRTKGKRLLALDDIVFDKSGGFWFTETGIQERPNPPEGRPLLRDDRRTNARAGCDDFEWQTASDFRRTALLSMCRTRFSGGSGLWISLVRGR